MMRAFVFPPREDDEPVKPPKPKLTDLGCYKPGPCPCDDPCSFAAPNGTGDRWPSREQFH